MVFVRLCDKVYTRIYVLENALSPNGLMEKHSKKHDGL